MDIKMKSKLVITLSTKEARTLDMLLCDYENEGEQHSGKEYTERMNPFNDSLRDALQEYLLDFE